MNTFKDFLSGLWNTNYVRYAAYALVPILGIAIYMTIFDPALVDKIFPDNPNPVIDVSTFENWNDCFYSFVDQEDITMEQAADLCSEEFSK